MPQLEWDKTGEKTYETGVDKGVLYPISGSTYGNGVAWNGLTSITESPSGAETTSLYADNIKYLSLISVENWKATIKAYTWPRKFNACQGELEYDDGTHMGLFFGQQNHMKFGLAWRTIQGL